MITLEQFKADWREKEKLPRDPNLKITCLCGNCPVDQPLTDAELEEIYTMLENDPKILDSM